MKALSLGAEDNALDIALRASESLAYHKQLEWILKWIFSFRICCENALSISPHRRGL